MYIVCKASECPPDAIVFPFFSLNSARAAAEWLNKPATKVPDYVKGRADKYTAGTVVVYKNPNNDPIYHFLPGKGWVPFL